jgi:hypothetical protein
MTMHPDRPLYRKFKQSNLALSLAADITYESTGLLLHSGYLCSRGLLSPRAPWLWGRGTPESPDAALSSTRQH